MRLGGRLRLLCLRSLFAVVEGIRSCILTLIPHRSIEVIVTNTEDAVSRGPRTGLGESYSTPTTSIIVVSFAEGSGRILVRRPPPGSHLRQKLRPFRTLP